ncbi:MAG: hypothetical protein NT132_05225 [Microbacterium sp.]|uniref:hypothetical protein n=1 Tax=Microbacterium sp. TaxID=51671 RepID=UPI00261B158A|nr:hypothetical protein [Microbacterium sp.]MCX6501798.1 hypothetical protein [Microbacterium sp.]
MAFDDFQDSFNARARDSFNTNVTNSANLNVGLDGVGNTDNSVNDSGNAALDIDGSFNSDSHDVTSDSDVFESTNTYTDDSTTDNSDNSVHDSDNTTTDNSWHDSGNTFEFSSTDSHAVNVGNREYNTGFGNVTLGGGGAGGGDLYVDGRATIIDGSVNQNVDAWSVDQEFSSQTIVGSGDGAVAAGGGVEIDQHLDDSTTFEAGGDINLDNTTTITTVHDSNNTEDVTETVSDGSVHWNIDSSFNDDSVTYTADNSFNDEISATTESDWNIDADVIWDSSDAAIVSDAGGDLPPL